MGLISSKHGNVKHDTVNNTRYGASCLLCTGDKTNMVSETHKPLMQDENNNQQNNDESPISTVNITSDITSKCSSIDDLVDVHKECEEIIIGPGTKHMNNHEQSMLSGDQKNIQDESSEKNHVPVLGNWTGFKKKNEKKRPGNIGFLGFKKKLPPTPKQEDGLTENACTHTDDVKDSEECLYLGKAATSANPKQMQITTEYENSKPQNRDKEVNAIHGLNAEYPQQINTFIPYENNRSFKKPTLASTLSKTALNPSGMNMVKMNVHTLTTGLLSQPKNSLTDVEKMGMRANDYSDMIRKSNFSMKPFKLGPSKSLVNNHICGVKGQITSNESPNPISYFSTPIARSDIILKGDSKTNDLMDIMLRSQVAQTQQSLLNEMKISGIIPKSMQLKEINEVRQEKRIKHLFDLENMGLKLKTDSQQMDSTIPGSILRPSRLAPINVDDPSSLIHNYSLRPF